MLFLNTSLKLGLSFIVFFLKHATVFRGMYRVIASCNTSFKPCHIELANVVDESISSNLFSI